MEEEKLNEDNGKEVFLNEVNIIIGIPEDAFEVTVSARYVDADGNIIKVHKKMNANEIYKARKEYEDLDIDDERYVLTDKGREFLESLERNKS